MTSPNHVQRGLYCLRCSSRKIVRGNLGEAPRFYPLRSFFQSLLSRPVPLARNESHACLDCGLAWNEVDPQSLLRNVQDFGLSPHATGVMQAVQERAE